MSSTVTPIIVNGVQIWGERKPQPVASSKPRSEKYVPHWDSAEER